PFNLDYLLAVVRNQFRIREHIHSSYLRGLAPILPDTEVGGEVVNFLARFNRILEEEVSNVDLSVDELAKRMNMGRSNFYKKFTNITQTSPNVYLARFRINKACAIMKQGSQSITEISHQTGFRNATYFSTLFKKEMGVAPSDYLESLSPEE
ncbi:MAG: helix-turn-helix transcriptional regulator, partial [Bacteroidetes bacterium]|nr:helix-turn-helix transcriptional regulator [Bacteroidota bacterium]